MKRSLKTWLRRLRNALRGLPRCEDVELTESRFLHGDKLRVPAAPMPIHLLLGRDGKHLVLQPDLPLDARPQQDPAGSSLEYLVVDPAPEPDRVGGFLRLGPGAKLSLGAEDPLQQALFDYPPQVEEDHFRIRYRQGKLVLTDCSASAGTCVAPPADSAQIDLYPQRRRAALQDLVRCYGGEIEQLPPEQALSRLQQVNALLDNEPYRTPDADGRPGAVIRLPGKVTPVLIADLHTKIDNLLAVLCHDRVVSGLEQGRVCVLIIGDAVHSEVDGEMESMDSSMLIMDFILGLKLRFPRGVFYLRGNHDSFDEAIAKGGIPQGILWERALRNARGKPYLKAMRRLYKRLPLLAYSKRFIACHAGPPTYRITREQLDAARHTPKLVLQLLTNRLQRPNRPQGYTRGDLKRLRKCLGVKPDTPVVVGHTPVDRVDTLWLDAGGFEHHHVLFSAAERQVGAITWVDGLLVPLRFSVEPLVPLFNRLQRGEDR